MLKNFFVVILIAIAIMAYIVTEPFGYIPFYSPDVQGWLEGKRPSCLKNDSYQSELTFMKHLDEKKVLGMSAGFYAEECGFLTLSGGFKNKLSVEAFQPSTINRVASISKPITAVAVMQLHEQGLININNMVNDYLKPKRKKLEGITVLHLLNHTSGVPHYDSSLDTLSFSEYETQKEAVDEIITREFKSEPGTRFLYSSFGYTILGELIETVTDLSFGQYLKQNIFDKAGMGSTSLETQFTDFNKSRLYIKAGRLFIRSPYTDLSIIYPGGGIQSTAEDLLRFGQAIIKNTLISKRSREIMIDENTNHANGESWYGLGWKIIKDPVHGTILSHAGAQVGSHGQFQVYLDKKVVSVALSNAYGTKPSVVLAADELGEFAISLRALDKEPR